jgi:hypothetical protein
MAVTAPSNSHGRKGNWPPVGLLINAEQRQGVADHESPSQARPAVQARRHANEYADHANPSAK